MIVWILYDPPRLAVNRRFAEWLIDAFRKRGADARLVVAETIADLPPMERNSPDLVVMRAVHPEISRYLESRGIRVQNNSHVATICNDKWATYSFLRDHGIESLPAVLLTPETLDSVEFEFPAVVKSRDGHGGTEVFWAEDRSAMRRAFETIGKGTAILQAPASDLGRDLRVYILGNRILAGMLRRSEKDFRSNFCLGGEATVYPLSREEEERVHAVRKLFDFGLAGIDFVFHHQKIVFNEIEDVVGSRMLYQMTDLNVAELYADYLMGFE